MAATAAKERIKMYWAIAATFAISGFIVLLALAAVTGSLAPGLVYAIILIALTFFAALYLMDIIWEGKGVILFAVLTMIVVLLIFGNMIFGRQAIS